MIKEPMRKVDPEIDLPVKGLFAQRNGHHLEILWTTDPTPLTEGMETHKIIDSKGILRDVVIIDQLCIISES